MNDIAFYIGHDGEKDWVIRQIITECLPGIFLPIKTLKGEIFSNTRLKHFIDEEIRHDHFEVSTPHHNPLMFSSGGEQKKALLAHIILKKPGYIIIDSVFESIDQDSRQSILLTLKELAATTLFIQIFTRKTELLPFIDTIYLVRAGKFLPLAGREHFYALELIARNISAGTVPLPIHEYENKSVPLVKMNNVSVQFNGRPVLQNICWEIYEGEFWHLKGPNGSGKSTLLSLITGNSSKGYGQELFLFGHKKGSGETVWDIKKNIGVFTTLITLQFERQDSVEQMVISGFFDSVGLYTKPSDTQVQRSQEWLLLLGMYNERHQPFRLLSEGRQRMILIARAMVKHPPLLILDEPTAGLDDEMVKLFTSLINKIAAESNTAILYVSHTDEEGLTPKSIYELLPSENGSLGQIKQPDNK